MMRSPITGLTLLAILCSSKLAGANAAPEATALLVGNPQQDQDVRFYLETNEAGALRKYTIYRLGPDGEEAEFFLFDASPLAEGETVEQVCEPECLMPGCSSPSICVDCGGESCYVCSCVYSCEFAFVDRCVPAGANIYVLIGGSHGPISRRIHVEDNGDDCVDDQQSLVPDCPNKEGARGDNSAPSCTVVTIGLRPVGASVLLLMLSSGLVVVGVRTNRRDRFR